MQFSVGSIFVLVTLAALLLAGNGGMVLVVSQVILVLFATHILTSKLPVGIQDAIETNSRRADGSVSERRQRIERSAVRRFRNMLITVLALVCIANTVVFLLVNDSWIPASVGIDAVTSFRISPSDWRDNLKDEERDLDAWGKARGLSQADVRKHKSVLWRSMPLFFAGMLFWIFVCIRFVFLGHESGLRELMQSIRERAKEYDEHDLQKTMDNYYSDIMRSADPPAT